MIDHSRIRCALDDTRSALACVDDSRTALADHMDADDLMARAARRNLNAATDLMARAARRNLNAATERLRVAERMLKFLLESETV